MKLGVCVGGGGMISYHSGTKSLYVICVVILVAGTKICDLHVPRIQSNLLDLVPGLFSPKYLSPEICATPPVASCVYS